MLVGDTQSQVVEFPNGSEEILRMRDWYLSEKPYAFSERVHL